MKSVQAQARGKEKKNLWNEQPFKFISKNYFYFSVLSPFLVIKNTVI